MALYELIVSGATPQGKIEPGSDGTQGIKKRSGAKADVKLLKDRLLKFQVLDKVMGQEVHEKANAGFIDCVK